MTSYMRFMQNLVITCTIQKIQPIKNSIIFYLTFKGHPRSKVMRSTVIPYDLLYVFHINLGHDKHDSGEKAH